MTALGRAEKARLVHDVGKYCSRTARNLPVGDIAPAILSMLCRDLYDRPLSPPLTGHVVLRPAYAIAVQIEGLQTDVRAGSLDAVRRAAHLAIELDVLLRALPDQP